MSKNEEIDYGVSCKKCKRKGYVMCHCDKSLKMKEELSIRAATVFKDLFPELWEHQLSRSKSKGVWSWWCAKCKENWADKPSNCEPICTVPDPMNINWDNAMRLRGEMRTSIEWIVACHEIYNNYTGEAITQEVFWRDYAIPKHYIEAACIAKEAENEAV